MFALSSEGLSRRRLMCGIAASVLLHVLLVVLLVFVAKGGFGEVPKVKRGEPLFVELPNINEPAPRGNPAAREAGPPPGAAAPSKPAPPAPAVAPAPAPRPPASAPPVVAKAPSVAPPAPVAPAPRAPAPTPRVAPPAPPVAEKAPAPTPPPERNAPAPPEPAPSRPQAEEVVRPAEPTRTARESTPPPPPPTGAQDARTPPGDQRTAMVPPSGSRGSPGVPDMRSALRRGAGGAGGGAGGTSDGRGGIEGEAIPLDSRDPRYSDYLDRIRRMIKEKWGYPCVKNDSTQECEYKTALLVIEFGIARDGKVPFVNVVRTSGFPIYDDYAVNAIKFAQPFPKVPDTMGSRAGVPIVATFSYQVDRSLVNLLR